MKESKCLLFLKVIDTPGVCDTKRSDAEIHQEITKALVLMAPGPHVLLLVVKGADRFTKEEMDAYEQLKDMFGPSFTNYIIVVFTGIDQLQSEGTTLEKQFANALDRLKTVLREAGNRYFGINNKASQTERQDQGRLLIQMIMQLVQTNNNKYYSNDLFKRFDDSITTIQSKNVNLNIQQIKERIAKNQIDSKRFESLLDLSNEKARIICILL